MIKSAMIETRSEKPNSLAEGVSPGASQHKACSARTPSRRKINFPAAFLIFVGLFPLLGTQAFSQSIVLESAKLAETFRTQKGPNGEILRRSIVYSINCKLKNATENNSSAILDARNWAAFNDGKSLEIEQIKWRPRQANTVKLYGNFKGMEKLSVTFLKANPSQAILVNIDEATVGKTKWGFGKEQAFDFSFRRLTQQKALYAFDHDFKINIFERNLVNNTGGFWLRSMSFNLKSKGTFASDDVVRNGTESSLELAFNPFYFASGLIYRSELKLSYQIDTAMNEAEDKLFDVINRKFLLGLEVELPWTNYPIFKLHTKTGYPRLAMPLTLNFDYSFSGNDGNGNDTLKRLDFKVRYELAFSPYLIIQGRWHRSKFIDALPGMDDTATYYSIAFAQDLDVVKKTLGVLKLLLGPEEEIRGKNFIFFRISKGRKAPAFEDIHEKSFGFGTYF
ncbi:MAG: hypothetical protein ACE5IR_21255 [bacterium]